MLSHSRMIPLTLMFLSFALGLPQAQSHADDDRFAKWEEAISAFEEQDRENPPTKGGVLFVGSSSIRLWDLDRHFPDLGAINRGFGGSEVADSLHFADRIIIPYEPRLIVMYAGDNDVAHEVAPCDVHSHFEQLASYVRERLPGTRIVFIAIKPSIKRWNLVHRMRAANALIRYTCAEHDHLTYLDIDAAMIGPDGTPRPELFRDDGLHLNDAGYEMWASLLRPHLK